MFSRISSPLLRVATRSTPSVRKFGSGAKVEYTGVEAHLRKFAPKDEHVVMVILGGYVGAYFLFKIVSSIGSKPVAAAIAAPAEVEEVKAGSDDIPDMWTAEFGLWIENEKNIDRFVAKFG